MLINRLWVCVLVGVLSERFVVGRGSVDGVEWCVGRLLARLLLHRCRWDGQASALQKRSGQTSGRFEKCYVTEAPTSRLERTCRLASHGADIEADPFCSRRTSSPLTCFYSSGFYGFCLLPRYRDYAYRSAPVSPRRTPSSNSAGSTNLSSNGDPFCTTYRDHVLAAADGKVGGKLRLPPLMDDATAAMESQVMKENSCVVIAGMGGASVWRG